MKSVSINKLSDFLGPVVMIDSAGIIKDCNAHAQAIFEEESSIMGLTLEELFASDDALNITTQLQSKTVIKAELKASPKLFFQLQAFEAGDGLAIGICPCENIRKVIANNIAVNKEIAQFIYSVSHDLKAPIRGISTLSGWLQDDLKAVLKEEHKETLGLLNNKTQELNSLMDALLNYSRVGRVSYFKKRLNLQPIIKKVAEDFLIDSPEIKINYPSTAIITQMDGALAEQLFKLIIQNSIDHNSTDNLKVDIMLEKHNDFHLISIIDNGDGMSEKTVTKAFDLFYKNTTKAKVGMGLTLAKKIVDVSAGRINLSSIPKEGTTVQIWLPLEESVNNSA